MANMANALKNSQSLAKVLIGVGALGYGLSNSFYTGLFTFWIDHLF